MKNLYLVSFFFFLSFIVNGQSNIYSGGTTDGNYQFDYCYRHVVDSYKEKRIEPYGKNITLEYDAINKKYGIIFTDMNGELKIIELSYFDLLDDNAWLMTDAFNTKYYIINLLKDKFVFMMAEETKGLKISFELTNELKIDQP